MQAHVKMLKVPLLHYELLFEMSYLDGTVVEISILYAGAEFLLHCPVVRKYQ